MNIADLDRAQELAADLSAVNRLLVQLKRRTAYLHFVSIAWDGIPKTTPKEMPDFTHAAVLEALINATLTEQARLEKELDKLGVDCREARGEPCREETDDE